MSEVVITAPVQKSTSLLGISKVPEAIKKTPITRVHTWDNGKMGGVILYGVVPNGAISIILDENAVKAGLFKKAGKGYIHAFGASFAKKEGKTLDTIIL